MPFVLAGPRAADGGGALRGVIEIHDNSPLRICFKPKEWNEIKRAALHDGGMDFIVGPLPLRFTRFAYRLGYHISDKSQIQKALNMGVTPQVMTEVGLWKWNSEKGYFELPNADRLYALYYSKVRAGEFRNTRENRKRFFQEFKRNVRKRILRDRQGDIAKANLLPLVDGSHGDSQPSMRTTAIAQAHVLATATGNKSRLEVIIPFGHPVQQSVSDVMHRILPEENERIARRVAKTMDGLLRGADVRTIQRGIAAGQLRMRLAPAQRESISASIPQRPHRRLAQRK